MSTIKFKYFFFLLFISILFITSCSKSNSDPINSTTPGAVTPCSFLPYKIGTKVKQRFKGSIYDYTYVDTVIYGSTFFKATTVGSIPPGFNYLRYNSSGEIIQFIPAQNLNGAIIPTFETTILKPNQSIGTTWTDSSTTILSGSTYASIYTYKIIDKGFTTSIFGTSYTDGIKIQVTVNQRIAGQLQQTSSSNYYWVCGFGFYKAENVDSGSTFAEVIELTL